MKKSNKKCLYLTINILILMLLILNSCVSLKEIHQDKVEFVQSIIDNPENCEEIIKSSKFYKKGLSKFKADICLDIFRTVNGYGKNNIEIVVNVPKIKKYENNEVYVDIADPDPRSRITFAFYSDGYYANKLKYVAILILGGY